MGDWGLNGTADGKEQPNGRLLLGTFTPGKKLDFQFEKSKAPDGSRRENKH